MQTLKKVKRVPFLKTILYIHVFPLKAILIIYFRKLRDDFFQLIIIIIKSKNVLLDKDVTLDVHINKKIHIKIFIFPFKVFH